MTDQPGSIFAGSDPDDFQAGQQLVRQLAGQHQADGSLDLPAQLPGLVVVAVALPVRFE